jgi:hypothetical protein
MMMPATGDFTSCSLSPIASAMRPSTWPRVTRDPIGCSTRSSPAIGARTHCDDRDSVTLTAFALRRRGSIPRARITLSTPRTPPRIDRASKRSPSPAS